MNPWGRAIKSVLSQPAFVVTVLLLAVSALTLNGAVGFLRLHFKKLPCPLRVAMIKDALPTKMGDWVQVSQDQPIDAETEQILGTSQYVFRDYADSSLVGSDEIEAMKKATPQQYEALRAQIQERQPQAIITAAVTYYTGLVDTVAHIPERCYVADGYNVSHSEEKDADLHGADGWQRKVPYRFLTFDDQVATRRVSRNVGYLFNVNGVYDADSFGVRGRLQDLRERYGYYAKVELMTQAPAAMSQNPDVAKNSAQAMEKFLTVALPELEKALPDWKALHSGVPSSGK